MRERLHRLVIYSRGLAFDQPVKRICVLVLLWVGLCDCPGVLVQSLTVIGLVGIAVGLRICSLAGISATTIGLFLVAALFRVGPLFGNTALLGLAVLVRVIAPLGIAIWLHCVRRWLRRGTTLRCRIMWLRYGIRLPLL